MIQTIAFNNTPNSCWFHRWVKVGISGVQINESFTLPPVVNEYQECGKCGARRVRRPYGSGYQPFNHDWVNRKTDVISVEIVACESCGFSHPPSVSCNEIYS